MFEPLGEIHPATVARRAPPRNLVANDAWLFADERERRIPRSEFRRLRDVSADHAGALFRGRAMLADALPLDPETYLGTRRGLVDWAAFQRRRLERRRLVEIDQDCVWISDLFSGEFFHWMLDALPRVVAAIDRFPDATMVLPGRLRSAPFVAPILERLGVRSVRYIEQDEILRFAALIVATPIAPSGNFNEASVRYLRERLRAGVEARSAPRRLYISRARAARRRVANEARVAETFAQHGYERILLEDLPIERQFSAIAAADRIASNHGAGLATLLLAAPGARALELRRSGDASNNCYYSLASALELDYYYLLCSSSRRSLRAWASPRNADLVVDCGALAETLRRMDADDFV